MKIVVKLKMFFLCSLLLSSSVSAKIYVIVNAKNPVEKLEKSQVIDIYTGRFVSFPGDQTAKPADLNDSHPLKARFYLLTTGLPLSKVSSYWARLKFTGRYTPPAEKDNLQDVIDYVSNNSQGIGYIDSAHADALLNKNVKVVYTVTE